LGKVNKKQEPTVEFKTEYTNRYLYWSRWFAFEIWNKWSVRESEASVTNQGRYYLMAWCFYQIFTRLRQDAPCGSTGRMESRD